MCWSSTGTLYLVDRYLNGKWKGRFTYHSCFCHETNRLGRGFLSPSVDWLTDVECNNFADESQSGTLTIIICQINNNQHQIGGRLILFPGTAQKSRHCCAGNPLPSTTAAAVFAHLGNCNKTITHLKWLITYRNIACQRYLVFDFNGCLFCWRVFFPSTLPPPHPVDGNYYYYYYSYYWLSKVKEYLDRWNL